MDMKHLVASLREVYSRPVAYIATLLSTGVVLVFYASLTNLTLIQQAFASGYPLVSIASIILSLVPGIQASAGTAIYASIIILSLLAGINITMLLHKTREYGFIPSGSGSSIGGVALAAFGSGCPACATGLLTIAGVSGGLAVLPFNGWELRVLSAVLLLLPIYWLSKDISNNGACAV